MNGEAEAHPSTSQSERPALSPDSAKHCHTIELGGRIGLKPSLDDGVPESWFDQAGKSPSPATHHDLQSAHHLQRFLRCDALNTSTLKECF